MKKAIAIRTGKDRLRYTIMFELVLLAILAPLGAVYLQMEIVEIGMLSVVLSLKAMLINYVYNWYFDQWDVRAGRIPTQRTFKGRILHAVGLEGVIVLTSLPLVIWWLGLTILQALIMDLAVTSIVVVYTIVFTWCYDRFVPVSRTLVPNSI